MYILLCTILIMLYDSIIQSLIKIFVSERFVGKQNFFKQVGYYTQPSSCAPEAEFIIVPSCNSMTTFPCSTSPNFVSTVDYRSNMMVKQLLCA